MNQAMRASPIVITGGAGFIGSNLAASFARDGYRIVLVDDFSRAGVERNWQWLQSEFGSQIRLEQNDIRVDNLARHLATEAAAIYHFAAQVAVTDSLDDPLHDFDINLRGTLTWLEAVRFASRPVPFIFASTNKVYGPLSDVLLERESEGWLPCDRTLRSQGIDEKRSLDFHTPYGCSKGGAEQYVLDYSRHFSCLTTVLRMSCIYGPRQCGTEDQGWLAHFASAMLRGETITLYGDGRQMRDVLFIDDAVKAYRHAWDEISHCNGMAFNLGGGPENCISLQAAIAHLEGLIGASARIDYAPWRAGDQRWYASNSNAIRTALSLPRPKSWHEGLVELAEWIRGEMSQSDTTDQEGLRSCA